MWRGFRPYPLPENSDILDQSPLSSRPLNRIPSPSPPRNVCCQVMFVIRFFFWLFGQVCGRRPVAAITGRTIDGTTVTDTTTATPLMCKSLL